MVDVWDCLVETAPNAVFRQIGVELFECLADVGGGCSLSRQQSAVGQSLMRKQHVANLIGWK